MIIINSTEVKNSLKKVMSQIEEPLYQNSLFLILSKAVSIGSGFFFWLAAARLYPVEDVGFTTALISSLSMITLFAIFGFDFSIIRFLPAGDKGKVYNTCLIITSISSIMAAAVYILCVGLFSPSLRFIQTPGYGAMFILFAFLNTVTLICGNALLALRKGFSYLLQNILLILRIILLLPLVNWGGFGIFGAVGLAYFLSSLYGFGVLKKIIGFKFQISKKFIKDAFKFSFWNYMADVLSTVPGLILPIMLLNLVGEAEAAKYFIASAIANIVLVIPEAISTSLFVEGSHGESLRRIIIKASSAILLFLAPSVLLIYCFGDLLLNIFGREYTEAFQLLRLLVLSSFFVAIYLLFIPVQNIRMKAQNIVIVNLIRMILLLSGCYFFILRYGIVGFGYAWMLTYTVMGIWMAGAAFIGFRKKKPARLPYDL